MFAQVETMRVDSQWHNTNLFGGNAEIARHEARVILAHGEKHVDVFDLIANEIERLRAIWFLQSVENQDYALMQGLFLMIVVAVLTAILAADAATVILDPRTRDVR